MSEEENDNALPWLYRVERKTADGGKAEHEGNDSVYRLFGNTRNPFLRRALAPQAEKLERSPADLQKLFRLLEERQGYRVAPANEEPPFRRRGLEHPAPPAEAAPTFQKSERLPADDIRLPLLVAEFFRQVLDRLREDPGQFYQAVDELTALADSNHLRFRKYESYDTLVDWDDLMRTLEEIARYPGAETFDLFCAALFAYRELV